MMRQDRKALDYFSFLYNFGFDDEDHYNLARYLHTLPYRWTLQRDENRMYDGLNMRREYEDYLAGRDGDIPGEEEECSMLEFFVGFSHRLVRDMMSDEDFDRKELLGIMLNNIDIWRWDDSRWNKKAESDIKEAIDIWVDLDYNKHGEGGLFPIAEPYDDLREVDMWVQASWWYEWNFG